MTSCSQTSQLLHDQSDLELNAIVGRRTRPQTPTAQRSGGGQRCRVALELAPSDVPHGCVLAAGDQAVVLFGLEQMSLIICTHRLKCPYP